MQRGQLDNKKNKCRMLEMKTKDGINRKGRYHKILSSPH